MYSDIILLPVEFSCFLGLIVMYAMELSMEVHKNLEAYDSFSFKHFAI